MFWRTIDFWNYSPDHGLVVVDMQTKFLDWSTHSMRGNVKKLIRKIGTHVEQCISLWGEVIFVEYEGSWETIAHIRNSTLRWIQKTQISKPGNFYRLMKKGPGLLSERPANQKYITANQEFFLKRKWKCFTVAWVNAYYCPTACAKNIDTIWCRARLDAWLILNVSSETHEQQIRRIPRNLIHAPGIHPRNFPIFHGSSFLDYL